MSILKIPDKLTKIYCLAENDKQYKEVLNEVIKYNKEAWKTLGVNKRINLKSYYPLLNSTCGRKTPNIFYILHAINLVFCEQHSYNFEQQYNGK